MARSPLDDQVEAVKKLLAEGRSEAYVAQRFGVGETTINRFRRRHNLPVQHKTASIQPSSEVNREEVLAAENAELRKRISQTRKSDVAEERVLQAIENTVPAAPAKFEAPVMTKGRHVHNLLLSDLHYGEVVDPEQVNDLNRFDVAILERRLEAVLGSVLAFKQTRHYAVNEIVVSMLGDMCSGGPGIHDEIRESNELSAAEQSYGMGLLLGHFVEQLVPHYERVRVIGVSGNHPRMSKPHASKNVFDNFDWLAYRTAETFLRNYESVSCHFPRAGMLVEQIAGRNVLLFHGDGIRSTMPGVPWGGVVRRINELKKQYAEHGMILHAFQLGHFHQANVVAGEVFMNGSLVGVNEYSLKNFGAGQAPTQLLLTWDAQRKRLTDVSFITP